LINRPRSVKISLLNWNFVDEITFDVIFEFVGLSDFASPIKFENRIVVGLHAHFNQVFNDDLKVLESESVREKERECEGDRER